MTIGVKGKFNCLRLEGSMGQFEAEDRGYISDEHFSGWLTIFGVDGLTYEVRTAKGNDTHLDNLDGGAERWGVECAFMRERGFDLVESAPATDAQPVAQPSPRPPEIRKSTVALDDLETYWPLRQALAWIVRRDANDVTECAVVSGDFGGLPRKIGGVNYGKQAFNYGQQALNQAFTALRQAIEDGELVVNGFVTAENKRRDITPLECLDLHLEWRLELASFATARVAPPNIEPAIRDLRVRLLDVLRIFPAADTSEHTGGPGRPPLLTGPRWRKPSSVRLILWASRLVPASPDGKRAPTSFAG
jgi:hypothetical protein